MVIDEFQIFPAVLPFGWRLHEKRDDGGLWIRDLPGQRWSVISSIAEEDDGHLWAHLSTALTRRLPTWKELVEVRDIWLPGRKCIQVLAPPSEHVNIMKNCLHLWSCLDGDPLPDFTHGIGSI